MPPPPKRPLWEVPLHLALSLSTGVLLRLLFPSYDLRWLVAIALTPLLIAAAREPSLKLRFLYGWLAGIVYWFALCNWIEFVLEVHGGMGRWGGWPCFFLLSLLKAINLGVF